MADTTDLLVAALDEGAKKLLDMALLPAKNEDGTPNTTTLSERVKAFDSVARWAENRLGIVPKEPTRSRFQEIQDEFAGKSDAPKRGRPPSKAKEDDGDRASGSPRINFLA